MTEKEEKRLQMIREKMAQIKAQEQAIIARDKKRQRKERTRRLIQYGTLVDKYFNCEGMKLGEFEELLKGIAGKS